MNITRWNYWLPQKRYNQKIKPAHIIVSPVKDDSKILVDVATFNELVNRVNRLEKERALSVKG